MSKKTKSVVIDAGHGGIDNGASGYGIREKDWALKISLYQYERLKKLGARVGITRTNDKSLSSVPRTNLIRGKYDIAVSNHWNAFNGTARGIETIHSVYSNGRFAKALADELIKATGLPFRRVFSRKNNSGGDYYYMHRMTGNTTTVIVEYGFIDNHADNSWYKNEANFKKAAEAVIKGICKEIGIKYVAPNGSSVVVPSSPSASNSSKSIDTLAHEVIAGKHGSGTDRRKALGSRHEAVQTRVNQILIGNAAPKPKPTLKSNSVIAKEVIAGKWGNGNDRKVRLERAGYNPNSIQAEVNRQAGVSVPKPKPTLKSNSVIAREVIAGKWGNGNDRKRNLERAGYNFNAVQAEVNHQASPSPKKSASQVANEIYQGRGGWGNGAERTRKLRAAGYNPSEIQRLVNLKFR